MNVVVDVGNTRMKYAFFRDTEFLESKYEGGLLLDDLRKLKSEGTSINLFLSGSGHIPEELKQGIQQVADCYIEADSMMELPLKIGYETQNTLGFDRIAICIGAMKLFSGSPLLVIDSGTCITYNYVNKEGVFLGGNIAPGVGLRFKVLNEYTAKLPLVEPSLEYGGIGKNTEEAVRNGVMDGMLFEVENYINHFLTDNPSGKVVITGGNSYFLRDRLCSTVNFCHNLGFIGLNEILIFMKNLGE